MNSYYPFVNTPLPYGYDALEPYIDEKTMHLHHDRHLQTYIDNLNGILKAYPELQSRSLEELLLNWEKLPGEIQVPVRNNAGGVYNHRFYFEGLQPPKELVKNQLYREIEEQFQGFDGFQKIFKQTALSVFGSGYAWLVSQNGMLRLLTSANQNVPDLECFTPVFTIDVWEHAYYLKHYNLRGDYVEDWFAVINWEMAQARWKMGESAATRSDGFF